MLRSWNVLRFVVPVSHPTLQKTQEPALSLAEATGIPRPEGPPAHEGFGK